MKIFWLLVALFVSCSQLETKQEKLPEVVKIEPATVQMTTPVPTPVVVVEENQNLDLKFQEDLDKIWSSYFTEDFTDTRAMNVFVATNRNLKGQLLGCTDEFFGTNLDSLTRYLVCRINVPKNHTTGQINFSGESRASSHDFFKVVGVKSFEENKFIAQIKKTKRIPLVFVHGFNVKYQEAILRASQLASDLKYQGPVVLFSWPAGSGDGFLDDTFVNKTYANNQKSAKESVAVFKNFLKKLMSDDIQVNLMIHSMGHQVVLPSISEMVKELESLSNIKNKKMINQLILNAPDFEAQGFSRIVDQLNEVSNRVTIYCSYNDNAMVASEVVNKNKRLGGCAFLENVDTINVSELDAPKMGVMGLGHGYYSSRPILTDVFQVLLGISAEKRLFIKKSEPNSPEKYFLRQ